VGFVGTWGGILVKEYNWGVIPGRQIKSIPSLTVLSPISQLWLQNGRLEVLYYLTFPGSFTTQLFREALLDSHEGVIKAHLTKFGVVFFLLLGLEC
jgi:hypothetical protein